MGGNWTDKGTWLHGGNWIGKGILGQGRDKGYMDGNWTDKGKGHLSWIKRLYGDLVSNLIFMSHVHILSPVDVFCVFCVSFISDCYCFGH